jgi:hypothetical protein
MATEKANGRNIFPSTAPRVKMGRKTMIMIVVAKNMG